MFQALKYTLRRHGISYRQLAREIKWSKSSINDFINKEVWPTQKMTPATLRRRITKALRAHGVPANEIETIWQGDPTPAEIEDKIVRSKAMLTHEILKRINCDTDPFTDELNEVKDVLPTQQHQFVLQKMFNAAVNAKFIAVHGPVGSGKSVMKEVLKQMLVDRKNFLISEPFIIEKTKCGPGAIQNAMIRDFINPNWAYSQRKDNKPSMGLEEKSRQVFAILRNKIDEGKKCVLIIDEAHDLPLDTIKALKRFHEYQHGFKKMLAIILVGQEELKQRLMNDYRVREVTARLDMVELRPIPNLVDAYVQHKVKNAGGNPDEIFDATAYEALRRLMPNAIPLMINNLASSAIIYAWKADQFPVTSETVEMAYKDIAGA